MPIKFSQFTNRTSDTATTTIVGFDGNQNIKILSSDLLSGFINGTPDTIPVFATANTLGDSIISQNSSATELYIDGNVGIGTTSPEHQLNLASNSAQTNIIGTNGSANGMKVGHGYDPSGSSPANITSKIEFEPSATFPSYGDDIVFSTTPHTATPNAGDGSTARMRITASGDVGIGTDPATKLHIADDTTPTIRIEDTTNNKHLQLFTDDNSSYIRSSAGTPIYFQTNGANTRMLISSGGNVGINSADFTTQYGVVPDLRVGSLSGAGNPGVIDILRRDGDVQAGEISGVLQFSVDDDLNYAVAQIEVESAGTAQSGNSGGGILKFKTTEPTSGATPTEHMRITSYGKVGIGPTIPRSKLHVDGAVQVGNDTDAASADKVGALRYYTSGNNSYVDMVMQTDASTYAWVNIVQNNW